MINDESYFIGHSVTQIYLYIPRACSLNVDQNPRIFTIYINIFLKLLFMVVLKYKSIKVLT